MLTSLLFLACSGSEPATEAPATPEPKAEVEAPAAAPTAAVTGSVGIVSVKNRNNEDPGAPVAGALEPSGELTVTDLATLSGIDGRVVVPISTFDSENPVRDERIQRTFFEMAEHPEIAFEFAGVDGVRDGGLVVDQAAEVTVSGRITMHGQSQDVRVAMQATRSASGATRLTTPEPFVVSIASFGMGDQLQALITECAHASVEDAVQVTVDLTLTPG